MRAITLWQPWASLIAAGAKRYETRTWATAYRGPLVIHAGQKLIPPQRLSRELRSLCNRVLGEAWSASCPRGAVVARAQLVACYRTLDVAVTPEERFMGNFANGRFAWHLASVIALKTPIAARGAQRLWRWQLPVHLAGFEAGDSVTTIARPSAIAADRDFHGW